MERRRHGDRISLYIREVGDLSFLDIGREHLSGLPKIHAILSDESLASDFILWNGRLLQCDEGFLPYFAGQGLANIEVYGKGRATLYYITTGGRDVLRLKDIIKKHYKPTFPAPEIS